VCVHWASVAFLALASSHGIHLQSGEGVAGRAWVSDPARWAAPPRYCSCDRVGCGNVSKSWPPALLPTVQGFALQAMGLLPELFSNCGLLLLSWLLPVLDWLHSGSAVFWPGPFSFCSAMAASVTSRSQPLSALVAVHFHQMLLLDQSCGELQRAWMPLLQHQPLNACDVELSLVWGLGYRSLWRL